MPTSFHRVLRFGDNIPLTLGHFVGYPQLFLKKNRSFPLISPLRPVVRIRRCLPDEEDSGFRMMMAVWTNEQEHSGLGGLTILHTRLCPKKEKAGRFPMRDDVGPAKNPIPRRQRNAQQGTRIQCSCWSISYSESKESIENLAGLHHLLMKYD